jgi:predicted Zn-dependent protease
MVRSLPENPGTMAVLRPHPIQRLVPRGLVVAAALLALSSCASELFSGAVQPQPTTVTESTPPPPLVAPPLDPVATREHTRLVQAFGGEYKAPQLQQLIAETTDRLAAASERPADRYRVTILNSPVVNAFALPNGNIYLTRGLLALSNDTAELAAVIAHEMAHVLARHAADRQELERTAELVNRVRTNVLRDEPGARAAGEQGRLAFASFSRQQELEADALGVRLIARAGFDPYGATRFLQSLARTIRIRQAMLGLQPGQEGLDINATHPSTPERIQLAILAARQIGAPGIGEADRNRMLLALQGMTFAEDAGQGFVRGRDFTHPRLGIAFSAPEGFVLENTRESVLGFIPNRGQALRFDAAKVADGQSAEAYLAGGIVEDAVTGPVSPLTVNGLAGATAVANGKDWAFRLFAVRVGRTMYRLNLAARQLDQATDEAFMQTIGSFRRLSSQEVQQARPLRIALVVASAEDTDESLAARMRIDEPRLDRFRMLNGLGDGERVLAGQRYKIVVD